MCEHRFSSVLKVIGKHEGPTSNQRQRLGRSLPGKTPSGRDTKRERPVGSRRFYDLEQIVEEHSRDMNLGHQVLHLDDLTGIDHRLEFLQFWRRAARSQKLAFLVTTRITHRQPHQEAVELRLGKRIRPRGFDRILGRNNKKRLDQAVAGFFDRYRVLAHRLEQRRLGAGRCSVDLVGEDYV